ncbi:MAG: Fis family transcriptional regulator [Spirochaetes bacterium]|nr:MAG: Fis family transcriptional regulator [Spirochaetota bacterium]RKX99076.1 MAG: Fis family transcriptional regulator [Spirochaetota bacterium]
MGEVSNEVRRLETLIEINSLINSQYRDVRVLLSRIMESAERLIGTDASSLLLVDSGTNQLYFEIALGDKGEDVKKYTLEMGEGIAGWVALNNRSLVVNDAGSDPRHCSLIGEDTGYKTDMLIAVPLRAKDEVIGVLEVINKSDGNNFNNDDLRFLEVLADQASIAIQNARDFGQLSSELDRLRTRVVTDSAQRDQELVWKSPKTEALLTQADRIALSDSPVLILGESGTGKELLADRLHNYSNRAAGPFIKVNCAAIPADLIESELFGYVKGAFTDAVRDKSGFFERAGGGSLFLDEIAELSLSAQAKLLRVLQNGTYQRVGGEVDVTVDVRVIAATNKDLGISVDSGTFRQDLYYRLAVLPIEVPPLRDRVEDIEFLAHYFLDGFKLERKDVPSDFSLEALEVLLSYRWPGNVRELQNAVERAVITCRGKKEITPLDLALPGKNRENTEYKGKNLKDSVTLFKKSFVREVLFAHGGNQTLAANALGIQRTYLSRMIKELNINHRGDEA